MAISKLTGKVAIVTRRIKRDWSAVGRRAAAGAAVAVIYSSNKEGKPMKQIINWLDKFWILESDIDYHLMRASMVIIFLFFGYQKWWNYEAQVLIPYISNGPLISWMYPVFGIRGACYFLGVSEWLFGALLFFGFWNKKLGILGALGGIASFVSTVTIIPCMPGAWAPSAGGFPAMTGTGAFLMKDVVLLAASFYLLKQDLQRVALSAEQTSPASTIGPHQVSSSPQTVRQTA
jgi:uncharacterized membrane protein YkgB